MFDHRLSLAEITSHSGLRLDLFAPKSHRQHMAELMALPSSAP
jgi:hypothetical protein